jgi:phytol kinase
MGILSSVRSDAPLNAELRRKTLHFGIGIVALSFPFILTTAWTTVAALGLVAGWMLLVRRVPRLARNFGCVLQDAGRQSMGEIYYAGAIGALLILPHPSYVTYAVPVLILTVSDALAAVIGRACPVGRLPGIAHGKTLAGSTAFLSSAFLITAVLLSTMTTLSIAHASLLAILTAATTCVVEAVSRRGLDNFTIPVVAWALLCGALSGVSS